MTGIEPRISSVACHNHMPQLVSVGLWFEPVEALMVNPPPPPPKKKTKGNVKLNFVVGGVILVPMFMILFLPIYSRYLYWARLIKLAWPVYEVVHVMTICNRKHYLLNRGSTDHILMCLTENVNPFFKEQIDFSLRAWCSKTFFDPS